MVRSDSLERGIYGNYTEFVCGVFCHAVLHQLARPKEKASKQAISIAKKIDSMSSMDRIRLFAYI
jgi:hypothetical protein